MSKNDGSHRMNSLKNGEEVVSPKGFNQSIEEDILDKKESTKSSLDISDSVDTSEGPFSGALLSYVSNVGEKVPGLAVLGEVKFIGECFGHAPTVSSSRYHKHILAGDSKDFYAIGHIKVLQRAIVRCAKSWQKQECPFTCHI